MYRRTFLANITSPIVAACATCLAACSKKVTETAVVPTPPVLPPPIVPPPVLFPFTIDLQTNLLTVGSQLIKNDVIIVRLNAGVTTTSFTAVERICTHAGGLLAWNTSQNAFVCPVHGSLFSANGLVLNGPASVALKKYTITINGTTLTINQ